MTKVNKKQKKTDNLGFKKKSNFSQFFSYTHLNMSYLSRFSLLFLFYVDSNSKNTWIEYTIMVNNDSVCWKKCDKKKGIRWKV